MRSASVHRTATVWTGLLRWAPLGQPPLGTRDAAHHRRDAARTVGSLLEGDRCAGRNRGATPATDFGVSLGIERAPDAVIRGWPSGVTAASWRSDVTVSIRHDSSVLLQLVLVPRAVPLSALMPSSVSR